MSPDLRATSVVFASNLGAAAATVICAAAVGGFLAVGCAEPSAVPGVVHARTVEFSGHTWRVRSSVVRRGPGPNYFSDSRANVWVDDSGRLHLRLTNVDGRWYAAEVISQERFGYGRYEFELGSPVHEFDPRVVLGFFTWNTIPVHHNREMDIEFSRFGEEGTRTNGDFVVQPYDSPRHLRKFVQPAGALVRVAARKRHLRQLKRYSVLVALQRRRPSALCASAHESLALPGSPARDHRTGRGRRQSLHVHAS